MGNNTLITNNLYSAKVSSSICCVFKSPSHAEDVPTRGDSHLHLSSPKKLKSLQVNVQARSCNFCRKKILGVKIVPLIERSLPKSQRKQNDRLKIYFLCRLGLLLELFLCVGDSLIPVLLCRAPLQPPQGPLETPAASCHRVPSFCREIWSFLKHKWGCTSYKGEGEFQQ